MRSTVCRIPERDPVCESAAEMEDPRRGRALAGAAQPRLEAV